MVTTSEDWSVRDRTVLVTGGTGGIGFRPLGSSPGGGRTCSSPAVTPRPGSGRPRRSATRLDRSW